MFLNTVCVCCNCVHEPLGEPPSLSLSLSLSQCLFPSGLWMGGEMLDSGERSAIIGEAEKKQTSTHRHTFSL